MILGVHGHRGFSTTGAPSNNGKTNKFRIGSNRKFMVTLPLRWLKPYNSSTGFTASRSRMRWLKSAMAGKLLMPTPSPFSQLDTVKRYGSQIVESSPVTQGLLNISASISSKHSLIVCGTFAGMDFIAASSPVPRHQLWSSPSVYCAR